MLPNFLFWRNITSYSTNLRVICQSQVNKIKYTKPMLHKLFHGTRNNAFKIANARRINEKVNVDLPKIITTIQNNVILYKNEKARELIMLKLLFYGWFWSNTALIFVTYNPEYITTWSACKSWSEYIKQNGTNLMYFVYSISIGPLTCAFLYQLNKRFIKYIILHKGGTQISVITSHVYKRNYTLTVPVDKVKVTAARTNVNGYLPLKIQNKMFNYLLDGEGKFFNGVLFDYTLGARKTW